MTTQDEFSTDPTCCGKMRRGRPPQMPNSAREAVILRVAAQMLLDIPFDDVTMAAIARAAGMSKRTVYEHFKNREDLLVKAIIYVSRTIFLPLSAEDAQRPLYERLSILLKINAPPGCEANKLEFLRSIIAKAQTYPVLAQNLYANGHGALIGFIRAEILRAVESGDIVLTDINADTAAEMLLDMAFKNTLTRLLHPGEASLGDAEVARRRELAIALFLRGCAP
jgi:AcrR family transcriptional regulator